MNQVITKLRICLTNMTEHGTSVTGSTAVLCVTCHLLHYSLNIPQKTWRYLHHIYSTANLHKVHFHSQGSQEADGEFIVGACSLSSQFVKMFTAACQFTVEPTFFRHCNNYNYTYQGAVLGAISGVTQRCNWRLNSGCTGTLVARVVWNHGLFQSHSLKLARKHFREKIFTPYNIWQEVDLAGGTLSYEENWCFASSWDLCWCS